MSVFCSENISWENNKIISQKLLLPFFFFFLSLSVNKLYDDSKVFIYKSEQSLLFKQQFGLANCLYQIYTTRKADVKPLYNNCSDHDTPSPNYFKV